MKYLSAFFAQRKDDVILIVAIFFFLIGNYLNAQEILFQENWTNGQGSWRATHGIWQVDSLVKGIGPATCYSPPKCAGTVIGKNYENNSSSSLESPLAPAISLGSLNSNEKILLKFWHWFRNSDDTGYVQLFVNNGCTTIFKPGFTGFSNVWTQYVADLSAYADSTIRIGFLFNSGRINVDQGWYIDDISIIKGPVTFGRYVPIPNTADSMLIEDFEDGINSWGSDNGLWEVGAPPNPPGSYSQPNCAGTVLSSNYPANKYTRFISASFILTPKPDKIPLLHFWHWYKLLDDSGYVQVSVDMGHWKDISTEAYYTGASGGWTQPGFTLSDYANKAIRIGFLFNSGRINVDQGWYIDDIWIENIENPFPPPPPSSVDLIGPNSLEFFLKQNYPNPFNLVTTIEYSILKSTPVEINIFNQRGQIVRELLNESQVQPGTYSITWDGRGDKGQLLSSGIYLFQIRNRNIVSTKKAVLLK